MNLQESFISGSFVIKPNKIEDHRGFFSRIYCKEEFGKHNIDFQVEQVNMSFCTKKGTIRGLHFQKSPFEEAKLLRCTHGSIFDVIVDLRPKSPSYLKWFGTELSEKNNEMIFVPPGCAHGYLSLEDFTAVSYMVNTPYSPGFEGGIRYDDPIFNIKWPIEISVVSEKDQNIPNFIPA
ncbi:dTDP-4-dehydrorhamnose 3,5-epimerase [Cecembia calidifontis]|jgi:dTDP-4-dehydrorhamnose 3,5-epimerase|uniref:dTDP-4-dehydrorhamnose 3,5-epimerase n=1 Tax=Cecembia calidifontis TaxID=1187080 RepID=A0A4Q7PBB3_9BACT|nr:dTDP-4-dehydrorhamnose 3,5-epimerase [Cecembia calidifontis]RZS96968.1 dTDP-4-dehydrorhamnose 3,5-epimerase [Cecembia calidifontis]